MALVLVMTRKRFKTSDLAIIVGLLQRARADMVAAYDSVDAGLGDKDTATRPPQALSKEARQHAEAPRVASERPRMLAASKTRA